MVHIVKKVSQIYVLIIMFFGNSRIRFAFKVNESRYKRCGVTPHFKNLKNSSGNIDEARSAIMIDNDRSN